MSSGNPLSELTGKTAGDIWRLLQEKGPTTAIKLKASLGISNTALFLALGWLEREDKVVLSESENTMKVALKQQ